MRTKRSNPAVERDGPKAQLLGRPSALRAPAAPHFHVRHPGVTMDFHEKAEVESSFRQIDKLLSCGIFDARNLASPLFRSAFIDTLICLRDLMYKTEKHAHRIDFVDDVTVRGQVKDVTSLIKHVRDAICHPESDKHYIEPGNNKATFNAMAGKGVLLKVGDFEQSNPYDDDLCFFFGSQRIFLRRHIVRALEESKKQLIPLLNG